jgi:hypothetical protein
MLQPTAARLCGSRRVGEMFPPAVCTRRVRAAVAMVLLVPQLTGCFQYAPVQGVQVPTGAQVSVGLTDRGRVAMTEAVGPGVRSIEGQLLGQTDTSLVLSVSSVRYFDLGLATWAGERVEVGTDYIHDLRERRFSRTRTWIAGAAVAGGLILASFIAIRGFGGDGGSDRPGNGNVDQ